MQVHDALGLRLPARGLLGRADFGDDEVRSGLQNVECKGFLQQRAAIRRGADLQPARPQWISQRFQVRKSTRLQKCQVLSIGLGIPRPTQGQRVTHAAIKEIQLCGILLHEFDRSVQRQLGSSGCIDQNQYLAYRIFHTDSM